MHCVLRRLGVLEHAAGEPVAGLQQWPEEDFERAVVALLGRVKKRERRR